MSLRRASRARDCSGGVGSMMNSYAYTRVSGMRARLWDSLTANLDLPQHEHRWTLPLHAAQRALAGWTSRGGCWRGGWGCVSAELQVCSHAAKRWRAL